jgi:hypothetical protein
MRGYDRGLRPGPLVQPSQPQGLVIPIWSIASSRSRQAKTSSEPFDPVRRTLVPANERSRHDVTGGLVKSFRLATGIDGDDMPLADDDA